MAVAQKRRRCTYHVPVETSKSCDPHCASFCTKIYGYAGIAVCERVLTGFCQCQAVCKGSR